MEISIKTNLIFETSDHQGWCSGVECEYEVNKTGSIHKKTFSKKEIKNNYFLRALKLKHEHTQGLLELIAEAYFPDVSYFDPYEEQLDCSGSGYCELSWESKQHGLDIHESRESLVLDSYKIKILKKKKKKHK